MEPVLIGYIAKRPWDRTEDRRLLPSQVVDVCNVGHMSDGAPRNWVHLWLHNRYWVYSTEAQAWGAAVDTANLQRLHDEAAKRWDGVRGSVQRILDDYIACHVPLPRDAFSASDPRYHWEPFAYRMFPLRYAQGVEEAYQVDPGDLQPVQALPQDYTRLGLDVVSRTCENMFECSPLNCNGHYSTVTVNRYCLLDQLETARQLARHWSDGKYREDGAYVGPAEPGPYFIVEVLRKQLQPSAQ